MVMNIGHFSLFTLLSLDFGSVTFLRNERLEKTGIVPAEPDEGKFFKDPNNKKRSWRKP
jgi:hypothetical protein